MSVVKPITPGEVVAAKKEAIPDEVIQAFNEEIALQWDGKRSYVRQADVVKRIRAKLSDLKLAWLDVEPIYRAAGWMVEYDKPAYNESGEAVFLFTMRR